MIEGLKPLYATILRPAIGIFVLLRIHPTHLTVLGVFVFAAAGWFVALDRWYAAAICVTMGALLDGWDGLLARETNQMTTLGAVLDSSCDRLTEIVWLGGLLYYFAARPAFGAWPVLLVMGALTGSVMVSYVKARAEGAGVECRGGLMQRPERIIVLGVPLLIGPQAMVWALGITTALTYFTFFQRIAIVRRNVAGKA